MDARPETSLEEEYASATTRARRVVASEYYLTVVGHSSPEYPAPEKDWREVWRLEIEGQSSDPSPRPPQLLLAVPKTFPDKLPSAYLPRNVAQASEAIPHLDDNGFLCTFDGTEAHPNLDDPAGVALRVIERGIEVWRNGVAGANGGDYLDEFGAYWALGSTFSSYSLVDPTNEAREVTGLYLKEDWDQAAWLFAENETLGRRWLSAVGYKGRTEAAPILYLPLNTMGLPPLPSTNGKIYGVIRDLNPRALPILLDFLQKHDRPTGVLFSVPVENLGRVLGAWWHPSFSHKVYQGSGPALKVSGIIPGFRQSKSKKKSKTKSQTGSPSSARFHSRVMNRNLSSLVELSTLYRAEKLKRSVVTRVDAHRIFQRTVGMIGKAFEHPVSIVGTGSIGSLAAESLARSGTASAFRLVDAEDLEVENAPRHYCGMADVRNNKAVATAAKLTSHFPHIECERHDKDILELLRVSPSVLKPSSLTLVAIGDITVERRLNRLSHSTSDGAPASVPAPLCFVWVEPHLYGGHAVYIRDTALSCFECGFDETLKFVYRVLSRPEQFSRREAGCQTTFVPYSGVDLQQFISVVTRFLLTAAAESPDNLILSWIGDIDGARQQGVEIQGTWAAATPFSAQVRKLTRNSSCNVCA